MKRQVALYLHLTALYPRSFRNEYSADMTTTFALQLADDGALRCWLRTILDLIVTVPTQRMESHMNRTSNHLIPLLYTAIATAGALVAAVGGTNRGSLIVGACIFLAAGAAAVVGWRHSQPIMDGVNSNGWWKFLVAGVVIVASVIVGAGVGVDAWFVGFFAIIVAFVLALTGVVLGLVHLFTRRTRTAAT